MQKAPLLFAAGRLLLALDVMDHGALEIDSPPLDIATLQENLGHFLLFMVCSIRFLSWQARVARLSDNVSTG